MEGFTKEVMSRPALKRHTEVSHMRDSGREEPVRMPRCQRPWRVQGAAGVPEGRVWELSFSPGAVWEYPGIFNGA